MSPLRRLSSDMEEKTGLVSAAVAACHPDINVPIFNVSALLFCLSSRTDEAGASSS